MRKVVWMFSGQGSQYFNMGRDLYESDPVFRETMKRCDEHIRRIKNKNESLLDVIYPSASRDRLLDFDDILQTHPALFCIQYSLAQSLLRRNMKPDLLLGYSLGEFVSAAVAEALPFETILEALVQQARLLKESVAPGAMLAILESPNIRDPNDPLYKDTWVSARNLPKQFVLSGSQQAIDRIRKHLQSKEIATVPLPVTFAFHSPHMDVIEQAFKERVRHLRFEDLSYPLVSASHVSQVSRLTSDFFWEVVRRPVRFYETITWLETQGNHVYVDMGPSGTMATFLKYALDRASLSTAHPIMTPFNRGADNLRRLESVLKESSGR